MKNRNINTAIAIGTLFLFVLVFLHGFKDERTLSEQPIITGKLENVAAWESIEMVRIPGGTFQMGSELGGGKDELPAQHQVTISVFWMARYEVSQAEWISVTGWNPSLFKGNDRLPVTNIDINAINGFIEKLNELSKKNYRLPTEAEWEYACRAGTTGDRYGNLDEVAWHPGNSSEKPHVVGQKKPNAFGLYDMLGNVWEYCADGYSHQKDKSNVLRGGCFRYISDDVSASRRAPIWRLKNRKYDFSWSVGFRLAMD